jgi:hypothetical protein
MTDSCSRDAMATVVSPQPPEEAVVYSEYVTMDEGAVGVSSVPPPKQGRLSGEKAVLDELEELFWELMDFNRRRSWKKKALTVFMVASTVLVVVDLLFLGHIQHWIWSYAEWMSLHMIPGSLLFIVLLCACTLVMIPPTILIFVCGFVFAHVSGAAMGIPAAVLASFMGCSMGAMIAFFRGTLCRMFPTFCQAFYAHKIFSY